MFFLHSPCSQTMTTGSLRKRMIRSLTVTWQTVSQTAIPSKTALLTVQTASDHERCNNKPFLISPPSKSSAKSTASPRNFINMHRTTMVDQQHRKASPHTETLTTFVKHIRNHFQRGNRRARKVWSFPRNIQCGYQRHTFAVCIRDIAHNLNKIHKRKQNYKKNLNSYTKTVN